MLSTIYDRYYSLETYHLKLEINIKTDVFADIFGITSLLKACTVQCIEILF